MNKKSKIVAILMILAFIVPLAVFGGPQQEKKGAAKCVPNCTYNDLVVGFIQTGSEGGWRAANTASFKETAE